MNMLLLRCSQLAWQNADVMNAHHFGAEWYRYNCFVHGMPAMLLARKIPMFIRRRR
jgi:hypothetical protein